MYIAHYDHLLKRSPHLLQEHVKGMLNIIGQFDLSFDPYGMTKASVVLHDSGKKSAAFQEYISDPNGKRGSVQHAKAGAYALNQQRYEKVDGLKGFIIDLVSLIVASHHRGLYDFNKEFFNKINEKEMPKELIGIERLLEEEIRESLEILNPKYLKEVLKKYDQLRANIYVSMLIRFVFSALVDADYLDTAAYFNQDITNIGYDYNFSKFQGKLNREIDSLQRRSDSSTLNLLRRRLQEKAYLKGSQEEAFYILRAPTGTGKTLASLKFALEHARRFNKNRIITALPLINLTEEVSEIYRYIFGNDNVTEDHSSVSLSERNSLKRVVTERWSTPFVVTTTVQLFESLYHNKPSKLRKLHHIYNSIIIIDEFHKLPYHVLIPIMRVLDILQSEFKVTVLMLSATPYPILESRIFKEMNLLNKPINIVEHNAFYEELPERVRYEYIGDSFELDDIVEKMIETNRSVLTIMNTRKEAQDLFCLLKESNHFFDKVYHLSTTMCNEHRKKVIEQIKELREFHPDKKLAVVSTSVLEAGVDLSFPTVFRMVAPLDSIIQAAGRCNRHNEFDIGQVVLFDLEKKSYNDEVFESGVKFVKEIIRKGEVDDLTKSDIFLSYYKRLLSSIDLDIYCFDGEKQNQADSYFKFQYMAERFKMIEDERLSIICPQAPGFNPSWLNEKRTSSWWNKMKSYLVPIPKYLTNYDTHNGLPIWKGEYHPELGIKL